MSAPVLNINTDPITVNELREALIDVPRFKATGTDDIPSAAYDSNIAPHLVVIMNNILDGGDVPPEWLQSEIVPIPKKGDLKLATNYRGISLMQTAAKLFDRIILLRIRDQLSTCLLNAQNGFRPARGTVEHILALRNIIDLCRTRKKSVTLIFVDFAKAFDSVSRPAIARILEFYGIPSSIIKSIMALYHGTSARVRTPKGPTDFFATSAGVLQGDTLAPFLFVLVVDYVLRTAYLNDDDFFELKPRQGTRTRTTAKPVRIVFFGICRRYCYHCT
jgi:hypothetical protein